MGVTGLWKLVDQAGKPVPLTTLENKVLAIDISIWLHQVVKGYQDCKGNVLPHAHTLGLFHRVCKLLFYRIKPVFVFDGGCPSLKRETIKKRHESKNQLHTEADRIQTLLMKALAKEEIVREALGPEAADKLLPKQSPLKATENKPSRDDMFKLPPMEDEISFEPNSSTDSVDEKQSRNFYNVNIGTIDVTSNYFKSLPPDIRHEILIDLKETRKQSSWGRLHELPSQRDDFSEFQMKKLLKRRQVQVSLEEAEQQMGGKCMTLTELEALMSEDGIVAASTSSGTQRIAYDDKTRYLLVRDIHKAMDEAKKREEEAKLLEVEAKKLEEERKLKKINEEDGNVPNLEALEDEDADLQRAIQMSLMTVEENSSVVKLNSAQRELLGDTGKSLARAYLLEYGGMNDEGIKQLLKTCDEDEQTSQIRSNSPEYVSSDADSDFIEVPDIDNLNDEMNKNCYKPICLDSPTKDELQKPAIELHIILDDKPPEDDIFKDIFENITPAQESDKSEDMLLQNTPLNVIECNSPNKSQAMLEKYVTKDTSIEEDLINENVKPISLDIESDDLLLNSTSESGTLMAINVNNQKTLPKEKLTSILDELLTEKENIKLLQLNPTESFLTESEKANKEITPSKVDTSPSTSKQQTVLDAFYDIQKTPTKSKEKEIESVPKVSKPFFVRKTPTSKEKKSTDKQSPEGKITGNVAMRGAPKRLFEEAAVSTPETIMESKTTDELVNMAGELRQTKWQLELERNKQNRMGSSITHTMTEECMSLLRLFGVPYIVAPMEAEAQCAYLNEINLTHGTITDDSDIWLFGGLTVYKNFFDQKKDVMEFRAETIEKLYNMDRHKLIQLAYLVGSDYTSGIDGIGPVTALEVLAAFPQANKDDETIKNDLPALSSLQKFREWFNSRDSIGSSAKLGLKSKLKNISIPDGFPMQEIFDAYLRPTIDSSKEPFTWGIPNMELIYEYTKKTFGWTRFRADEIVQPVLKKFNEKPQSSIKNYFQIVSGVSTPKRLKVSKRVQKAINHMSGVVEDAPSEATSKKRKSKEDKPKAKPTSRAKQTRKSIPATVTSQNCDVPQPSISADRWGNECASVVANVKTPKIPETNIPIPQRQMYMESMELNKQKAIEIFNKKNNPSKSRSK